MVKCIQLTPLSFKGLNVFLVNNSCTSKFRPPS